MLGLPPADIQPYFGNSPSQTAVDGRTVMAIMNTKLILRVWQENEELRRRREELSQSESELAEHELRLMNLRAELAAFERRYVRVIGTLYVELDQWNKKFLELTRGQEMDPTQTEKWRQKIAELLRGTEDEITAGFVKEQFQSDAGEFDPAIPEEPEDEQFTPSPSLKSFYREAAKRVHPDLAIDDADRAERQRLMAEVNAAYQRGDFEALRRILEDYKENVELAESKEFTTVLARITRQIKQAQARIAQIGLEMTKLNTSELARLKERAEAAAREERDLLQAMAENIRKRIQTARYRYETCLAERGRR